MPKRVPDTRMGESVMSKAFHGWTRPQRPNTTADKLANDLETFLRNNRDSEPLQMMFVNARSLVTAIRQTSNK